MKYRKLNGLIDFMEHTLSKSKTELALSHKYLERLQLYLAWQFYFLSLA